jgi:hypothetical protein
MSSAFNAEYDPTGVEGAIDTNRLRWLPAPQLDGVSIKPLRTSLESGFFTAMLKIRAGAALPAAICLGGMDLWVLSGALGYHQDGAVSHLEPGVWGYVSANSRVDRLLAEQDAELLVNFYSGVAFLNGDGSIASVLTSLDALALARAHHSPLVPNTLAYCAKSGPDRLAGTGDAMAIASRDASRLVVAAAGGLVADSRVVHPHFADTRSVPWAFNPDMPQIGLKVLRISEETGHVTLVVRHNGEAPPHRHLSPADFLILHGVMGYRAGPPQGTGPGVWVYEPAGARHDATQRLTDEDLIYTANLYGPLAFDSGKGTPLTAVLSWMEYKAFAEAAGARLVPNAKPEDSTLLAWAPLRQRAA